MQSLPLSITSRMNNFRLRNFMLLLFILGTLAACYIPPNRAYRTAPAAGPSRSAAAATVYVYPASGQSDAKLDRDRYECNVWAVKQSGYDPSQLHVDAERVNVISGSPPGASTAAGAITGAILGAAVSRPREAAGGAIIGSIAGAMIGSTADAARQQEADKAQENYDRISDNALQQAGGYRRAITACLESRGYTVK